MRCHYRGAKLSDICDSPKFEMSFPVVCFREWFCRFSHLIFSVSHLIFGFSNMSSKERTVPYSYEKEITCPLL